MANTDKFLIGIVIGILLLVVVALVITLIRPETTYQAEHGPKNIAHNYLLALQRQDYARAYGYLSPTLDGYPDSADEFTQDVYQASSWLFDLDEDTSLAVESARVAGERAVVKVRESHFDDDGLFGSDPYTSVFEIKLQKEENEWKIVDADSYFVWCWKRSTKCP